jgi:apolipoprotein N-acyltransferase
VESAVSWRRAGFAVVAVTFTAVMIYFGNGLMPRWPLLWLAPLPVLLFACGGSWWGTALTAFFAWLLGSLNLWHFMVSAMGMPALMWVAGFGFFALMFAVAVLLFRTLLRKGAPWSALLAFPATWVSFEYLRNLLWAHGTGMSMAYSQLNFLPFLQFASIAGPWGMSFLLFLFPAGIAVGWHLYRGAPKQAMRIVGASVGLIVLVLIFGAARLNQETPGPQVKVGLIASDVPEGIAASGEETDRLLRNYAAVAEKLAAQGAQVIVLPEKIGVVVDPDVSVADAIFQPLADHTQATIVAGMIHAALPVLYNQARIYAPGVHPRSYDKHHLLPPFESKLKPGSTLTYWPEPSGIWGIEICKDMDFTQLSRRYGEAGAGLMLAPGWDFVQDRFFHGHIAVMRGVEDGFSIVRAARSGYLTVSDDRGRIRAETQSDSARFATLIAETPAGHETTLYLLLGDCFAWVALAVLVFSLGRILRVRRRARSA